MHIEADGTVRIGAEGGGDGSGGGGGTQRNRSVFAQASPLMLGRALSMVATVLIPLTLARYLAPDSFGTYKQAFLLANTFHYLLQMGMAQSLFYFMPSNSEKRGAFVVQSFIFLSVAGLIGAGICWAGAPIFAVLLNNESIASLGLWIALYILFQTATTPLEPALTASGRLKEAAFSYMATDWLRAILLIVPVVLGGGIVSLMACMAIFAFIRAIVTGILLVTGSIPAARPEKKLLSAHLAYALPFAGAVVMSVLHVDFHSFFVSYMTAPAIFAIYSVGCFQLPVVNLLYTPVSEVMMVRIAELSPSRIQAEVPGLFKQASGRLAMAFFPLAGLMLVSGFMLIPFLFTEQYMASVAVFMVAVFEIPLAALPVDGLVRSLGETRFLVKSNIVRLVAAIALVPAGYFLFGLPGAAGGHVMSGLINRVMVFMRGRSMLGKPAEGLLPGTAWAKSLVVTLFTSVAALVVLLIMAKLGQGRFISLALAAVVAGIVYVVMLGGLWVRKMRGLAAVGAMVVSKPEE